MPLHLIYWCVCVWQKFKIFQKDLKRILKWVLNTFWNKKTKEKENLSLPLFWPEGPLLFSSLTQLEASRAPFPFPLSSAHTRNRPRAVGQPSSVSPFLSLSGEPAPRRLVAAIQAPHVSVTPSLSFFLLEPYAAGTSRGEIDPGSSGFLPSALNRTFFSPSPLSSSPLSLLVPARSRPSRQSCRIGSHWLTKIAAAVELPLCCRVDKSKSLPSFELRSWTPCVFPSSFYLSLWCSIARRTSQERLDPPSRAARFPRAPSARNKPQGEFALVRSCSQ